jgi:prepilin-type N-terminal cleavage/methylation domain-containing protein
MCKIKKNNKGFTLIEVLLVVGFMALAGLAVYTLYNKVNETGKASNESKNIDLLKAGVKNIYGGKLNYNSLTNAVLNDSRVTPDIMRAIPYITGDTSITNSFGGAVNVTPITLVGTGVNKGFQIEYNNVPGSICSKLVSLENSNFSQIKINSTIVKSFGNSLDVAALTTQCIADTGNGVTIQFETL